MYISVLRWKGFGRHSMHKLTGIREYQQKNGKSLLDSELGEINDVIGRKCLGCEALCLQKFSIRSDRGVTVIHILQ